MPSAWGGSLCGGIPTTSPGMAMILSFSTITGCADIISVALKQTCHCRQGHANGVCRKLQLVCGEEITRMAQGQPRLIFGDVLVFHFMHRLP